MPSHTSVLEARLDGVDSFPFIPGGLTILWRQDGAPLLKPDGSPKSGSTDDLSLHRINTGDPDDVNFDATDTGSVIDFVINGTTFSNPVILSNVRPTLTGATVVKDAFNRVPKRPSFRWIFGDADGDPQFLYQVKVGTGVGLGNVFDTGQVKNTDSEFDFPSTEPELAAGSTYYWSISVSDGEKTDPLTPDTTTDRVLNTKNGTMVVNTAPLVLDVKINGVSDASISSYEPVISWTYSDTDGQPQQSFRVRIDSDASFGDPIWDTGVVSGTDSFVTYNFDGNGGQLLPHVTYTVGVTVYDTLEASSEATSTFDIASNPVINTAFVDDNINPTNLKNTRPTFTWEVTDPDDDPVTAYEIRVADNNTDLGTDSFVGNIWHPGVQVTPESFEATLEEESGAFPGCVFPKDLVSGVTYYFQVQVYDEFGKSEWFTGFFALNNPPSATDLAIVPSSPFTSDDLEATWTFVDDPGESESDQSQIRWFRNGVEVESFRDQRTIPSENTTPFEEWFFTVRPHDGVDFGGVFESSPVVIVNRAPTASSLAIQPTQPKTGDALEALFTTSDPDGDTVTVRIQWFKNGEEQFALRNKRVVQSFLTNVDDEWYFTVLPSDGFANGNIARSGTVTIENTPPDVLSLSVDDQILPSQLDDPNPIVSWTYVDADNHPQRAYRVLIGTSVLRTRRATTTTTRQLSNSAVTPDVFFCGSRQDGIISVAADADVVSGNEIFDSGVVSSPNQFFQYVTEDFVPTITLAAPDAANFNGYELDADLRTIRLGTGDDSGTVQFSFIGVGGTYETEIFFSEDGKKASYELLVDGVIVDRFSTLGQQGTGTHKFRASNINSGARITVRGRALDPGAKAAFTKLAFSSILEFETDAADFDNLSGYTATSDDGIKLVGLAGSAVLNFPFPSGDYDIELVYQTESNGNPTMSVSVNSSVIDSFSFESGVKTRSRFISGITLNSGDIFKINGSRGGAASARVRKVVFKPVQTVQAGVKLRDGIRYYASVKVFDGRDWSDWHTTRFTTEGSAWVSSVSNNSGWTIEARFAVTPSQDTTAEEASDEATTETTDAEATEDTETTTASEVTQALVDALNAVTQTAQASEDSAEEETQAQPLVCENDTFQGIRFYDGTAFGWLRLKPDKVELLVDEPLEVELDGTEQHTYRITVMNTDIKLYVDNELKIDGTGRFVQPTSRKLLEFGDIAGRLQTSGSEWESFRYSVSGAYAPNSLVDFSLDEIQRFPDASIGRLKEYNDSLFVSVDSNDPEKSSMIFRYDEGFEPEPRSVLAVTKSTVTSVVVDPNKRTNLFDTSGKFLGTNRGLQYMIGSKPFPFDLTTLMNRFPEESGEWSLESTCERTCRSLFSGIQTIDTTLESGGRTLKYTQALPDDIWVNRADNEKGWTIEARVKIVTDGSGDSLDRNSSFIKTTSDQCDPAQGLSIKDIQTIELPEDDGLNAPGILINDGRFQEVVQFFSTGVRLKYARLFAEQDLTDQFYTFRIIGKNTSIAVYAKGDQDRFFRRVLYAPEGLFIRSQTVGDQESPHVVVDKLGVMHVVYQDSQATDWGIFYTKSLPREIVARGSGMYTKTFADFEKFVQARPGFGLPTDTIGSFVFDGQTLFSGGASFISWGVRAGDVVFAFSNNDRAKPRKLKVSSVPHETILQVSTDEDLSNAYNGADFVILRGDDTWLPPVPVSTESLDSNNPRMLISTNLETFVVYQNSQYGSNEIFLRRGLYDPFYTNWGLTARITNARYDSSNPDIAQRVTNGNIVLTWQDSRNNPNESQIFISEIDRAEFGVLEQYQNRNITPDSARAKNARVATIDEKVFVVYQDDPDDDGEFDIFVVELDSTLKFSDPVQVSSGNGNCQFPVIAAGPSEVYIAYQTDEFGPKEIVAVRGSDALSDTSWGSPERITNSRGTSQKPDIKVDANNNVYICFQDDKVRKDYQDLYVAKYDAVLGQWLSSGQRGLDIKVETYVTSSCNPSIALDQFGNIGIVWEAGRQGELKKIARAAFDGTITMDNTVAGYFPLDDNGTDTVVQNQFRNLVGAVVPPVEVVILANKSAAMDSDDRILDVKSVAATLAQGLQASDLFNIVFFDAATSKFVNGLTPASDANKTSAETFVDSFGASGKADLNSALITALAQGFTTNNSKNKIVVVVGDGNPTSGVLDSGQIRANFASANTGVNTKVLVFGVSGATRPLYDGLVLDTDGSSTYMDDFGQDLDDAFADFFDKFEEARNSAVKFDYSFEAQQNGTAADNTDLYHIAPPDDGVSTRNPDTQGAFDLNENGKVFTVPKELVNPSGAIDLWLAPHWPSDDITERAIFGNAGLATTDANTMVLGVRPAASGNDLFFRLVDGTGVVRETSINNPSGSPRNFDWEIGDVVHIRAIWDQTAVGVSTLRSVSFPTTGVGYACSENGLIWKTTDGGTSWVSQSSGVTYELYSVDFIDASTGWACGEFGTILKTTDGGDNWAVQSSGTEDDLNGIFFRTSLIGYAVGAGGVLLRSENGGSTWTAATSEATSDFYDVAVLSDGSSTVVAAVGANNQIYRSLDDGLTYSRQKTSVSSNWNAISRTHQAGPYATYIVGDAGSIQKTTNNGAGWTDLSFDWENLRYRPKLYGVSHGPDSDYVYVVGQNGTFASSTDGATFLPCDTGVRDGSFRSIDANFNGTGSNDQFVAVGAVGTVLTSASRGAVQVYSVTSSGNVKIVINGIEPPQTQTGSGPFRWEPQELTKDLVFGDYRQAGDKTANAIFDEVVIYSAPPPNGALFRRKPFWIFQSQEPNILVTENQNKRIEWGDISSLVSTKSYWTEFKMYLCGAKEPTQVFAWDSQLGLVDDVVHDLATDKSGRLWIATENGVTSFDMNSANDDIDRWLSGQPLLSGPQKRFINYTNIVDGLVSGDVTTITVDEDDNVWAGTNRGLMFLELNESSFVEGGPDPVDVQSAIEDTGSETGEPGLGTFASEEVSNIPTFKFQTITKDDGLPSNRILTVEALAGAVFVGTDEGMAVIRTEQQVVSVGETTNVSVETTATNGEEQTTESSETQTEQQTETRFAVSVFTTKDGLPSNRIQAIAQERRTGEIWIGTDRGLARFFPDGSVNYDTASGLGNSDIFSITIDDADRKYVGTGFGITRIDGVNFESFQPSEGIGFGAVLDGDEDGSGIKWFATADGLLEMNEVCTPGEVNFVKYDIDDGILGLPNVENYQRYMILGGDIPFGGCNKALVGVAVNGRQLSEGFSVDPCVPWVIFDNPLSPSDKVDVCVHKGWRKSHDFGFDSRNPEGQAFVETELTRFLVYRKRFPTGDVVLGANFALGAANKSTAMYSVFAVPVIPGTSPISTVAQPTGASLNASAEQGDSIYSDSTDEITVLPVELVNAQNIALPSADSNRVDQEYLEFTLASEAFVFVAYDSRATSLPGWLREFEPLGAIFRVTDMDTFVDATNSEKLFASVAGTTGCVFEILKDPEICDISDQIALDSLPPDGCAEIVRLSAFDEAVLSLTATDAVTGVADMQVSAFENFTSDGDTALSFIPFQSTFTLQLPVEAIDPIIAIENSAPPDDNPLDNEQFPDIEYTIVHEHNSQLFLGTKNPGRVFLFNRATNDVSFVFDTGEDEILSMVSFGSDLIVGTGGNGRAFRWDGTTLTQLLIPDNDRVTALSAFDNRVFIGTAPDGKIFELDQFGNITLFRDTNESSVDGFAIFGGQLFWITSNDQVQEGDELSVTTRDGHKHNVTVQAGATRISEVNGTTTEVEGHTHSVVNGVVQAANGHTHQLNGSRSGKVFRLDIATDLVTIVHSDADSFMTAIASTTIENQGLMFIGTFPNGKILRYVPEEGFFIKSFDTTKDRINRLRVIDGVIYAIAEDDMFFFDGRRWQFFSSVSEQILDLFKLGDDILIVRSESLGTVGQVSSDGAVPQQQQEVCAFVRFRDAAGNVSKVRDDDGNLVDCYRPCFTPGQDGGGAGTGAAGTGAGDGTAGAGGDGAAGTGSVENPLLTGAHRIVEVNEDARVVFRLEGPDPFLSGDRIEKEVGIYCSEVFNGTTSLVQWTSLSWTGSTPAGTSITIAVRSANTAAEIDSASFGPEFTNPTNNDLTNLTGQFLQFRATLCVTEQGVLSPQLDFVDIKLRTSQAVHYFTTNFRLPDELRRGILTFNGCLNPPATDLVFGISGKDSVDFSDYFVISPDRVFEVPSEHQTQDLRVGIKLISSPDTVPVVDEFALLFSLANDAKIRLNLAGDTGTTDGPPITSGDTRTVVTERVQGHTHTITFDSDITDKAAINGQTSINAGHSHTVINGTVQQAAGHTHEFEI